MDQHAADFFMVGEIGIDGGGEAVEVFLAERPLGIEHQDAFGLPDRVVEHRTSMWLCSTLGRQARGFLFATERNGGAKPRPARRFSFLPPPRTSPAGTARGTTSGPPGPRCPLPLSRNPPRPPFPAR